VTTRHGRNATSSSPHDPPFSSILSYQCSDLKPPVPKNSEQGARFASFKHTVPSAAVHRQLKLAIYPQALYTVNGTHAGSAYVSSASAAPLHLLSFILSRPFLLLASVIISSSNYIPPNLSTRSYGKDSHETRNDSSTVMIVLPRSSSYPRLAKRRLDSCWMVPLLAPPCQ